MSFLKNLPKVSSFLKGKKNSDFENSNFENTVFWIFVIFLMIFLRIPSFFEPWWYGDENIYGAVAQAIMSGKMLYVQVWDNKPPLIYLIYGLNYLIFGNNLLTLRLFNGLLALLGVFSFLRITQFFDIPKKISKVSTIFYILISTILFEGTIFNGENIFVPLVLAGFWLVFGNLEVWKSQVKQWKNLINWKLMLGIFLWSLAILTKIHALIEISVLILAFLVILIKKNQTNKKLKIEKLQVKKVNLDESQTENKSQAELTENLNKNQITNQISTQISSQSLSQIQSSNQIQTRNNSLKISNFKFFLQQFLTKKVLVLSFLFLTILGFPYLLTLIFFRSNLGVLYFSILGFSSQYVVNSRIPSFFNLIQIPVLSWLQFHALTCFLGILLTIWAFWTNKISEKFFILILWFLIACFGVLIPGRGYPHYILQVLPIFVIFWAFVVKYIQETKLFTHTLVLILCGILLTSNFWRTFDGQLTYLNLPNYFSFWQTLGNTEKFQTWQTNFDHQILTSQKILVPIIQSKTKPKDEIFILGNRPDLYILSNRTNSHRFVADYHILPGQIDQVIQEVKSTNSLILIDSKSPFSSEFIQQIQPKYQLKQEIIGFQFWEIK